jgi:diguanylate cyclase (GGDEF)-like protein
MTAYCGAQSAGHPIDMSYAGLLLTVVILQQGFLGLIWLGAAYIGLARRSAWHWGAAALIMSACLVGVSGRDSVGAWLGYGLANMAGVVAMLALRRGVQIFCNQPPGDRDHLAMLVAAALGLAWAVAWPLTEQWTVLITSLALAWPLLGAGSDVASRLRFEFGRLTATCLAMPLWLLGAGFAFRAMLAPWATEAVRPIGQPTGFNAGFGIAIMIAMLVLHFTLAAMVVLRLVRQLRHLSDHDTLTGVLNRRGFEEQLKLEGERLRRYGTPFAVLSIDIDHFKQINDRFGHDVGDDVLTRVATALGMGLRDVDRIGRVGGEEFCVLLPHSDEPGAAGAAQRMRQRVHELQRGGAEGTRNITVSIGVALASDPAEPQPELMRRLDRALYRAKDSGRDRVEVAEARLPSKMNWSAA